MRTPGIVIAQLSPDDADAIRQAAGLIHTAWPDWKETLDDALAEVREALEPGRICLVARGNDGQRDTVLGWVGAIPTYDYAWELHPLVVRAGNRGRGVGRALVGALEEELRSRGALTVYLGTDDDGPTAGTSVWGVDLYPDPLAHAARLEAFNHPAGFYRKLGYVVVGLVPDANGPGKPDILMAKRLTPGMQT